MQPGQDLTPRPCSDLCNLLANAIESLGDLLFQALLHVAARLQGQRAILGLLNEIIHLQSCHAHAVQLGCSKGL